MYNFFYHQTVMFNHHVITGYLDENDRLSSLVMNAELSEYNANISKSHQQQMARTKTLPYMFVCYTQS